jgi:hypothetical protein
MSDSDTISHTLADVEQGSTVDPRIWLTALAGLLSRCEHYRFEMSGRRLGADAALLLDRTEKMILQAEELANETIFQAGSDDQQADAVARAGVFITTAHSIETGPNRGLLWSVMSKLTGSGRKDTAKTVRDTLEAGVDALESYFHLFSQRLMPPTPSGWVEAANAFAVDFREAIGELPE